MNASVEIALQMPSVKTQTDHFHVAVRQATKEMASTVQVCDHLIINYKCPCPVTFKNTSKIAGVHASCSQNILVHLNIC